MGQSPKLAQMVWPISAATKLPHHGEFRGLEKHHTLHGRQSETVKYKVFAGTWNVGGLSPPDDLDLEDWLDTKANCYDICVLGFQEIVPLNARNVLGPKKRSAATKWDSLIGDALNSRRRRRQDDALFRRVMSKQMVGVFVSVWARSGVHRRVRDASAACVGAGVLGRLGNKGAVSVRFLLHGTSFCFVCCHLASGGEDGDFLLRNAVAGSILSRTTFRSRSGDELPLPTKKILDHDRVVLLGDLNYRVAMDDGEARQLVDARKWGMLLENDELRLELSKGRRFDGWREGPVTFPPTYKYHRDSDKFYWCSSDGSKKPRRVPAWCDRVLWRGKGMRQIRYERCGGYRLSDHRPVRALFDAVCELADGANYC